MKKNPSPSEELDSKLLRQFEKPADTKKSKFLISLFAVVILVLSFVLWAKAQTIIRSANSIDPELAKDPALWAIVDPISFQAEVEKFKTPEQLAREAQAVAEFADPVAYTAHLLETDPEYAKAYNLAAFSITNPPAAAALSMEENDPQFQALVDKENDAILHPKLPDSAPPTVDP